MSYVLREKYEEEESMDLFVKGPYGDQGIMKNCIVCMMGLTW
jgi:hypothetical protein